MVSIRKEILCKLSFRDVSCLVSFIPFYFVFFPLLFHFLMEVLIWRKNIYIYIYIIGKVVCLDKWNNDKVF